MKPSLFALTQNFLQICENMWHHQPGLSKPPVVPTPANMLLVTLGCLLLASLALQCPRSNQGATFLPLVMNLFHLCQNKIKLRVQRLQFVNNNLKINQQHSCKSHSSRMGK
jgi:hypothetical protein